MSARTFFSFGNGDRLLAGRDKRTFAADYLKDIVAAKLIIDFKDCVLINSKFCSKLTDAFDLIALFEHPGCNLVLDLVNDLPVYRHGRRWLDSYKNGFYPFF
jgi:hypothetical protein